MKLSRAAITFALGCLFGIVPFLYWLFWSWQVSLSNEVYVVPSNRYMASLHDVLVTSGIVTSIFIGVALTIYLFILGSNQFMKSYVVLKSEWRTRSNSSDGEPDTF